MEGVRKSGGLAPTTKPVPEERGAEAKGISVVEAVSAEISQIAKSLVSSPTKIHPLMVRLSLTARVLKTQRRTDPVLAKALSHKTSSSLTEDEVASAITTMLARIPEENRVGKLKDIAAELVADKAAHEASSLSAPQTGTKSDDEPDGESDHAVHARTGVSKIGVKYARIEIDPSEEDEYLRAGISVYKNEETGKLSIDLYAKSAGKLMQNIDMESKDPEVIAMETALQAIADLKPFSNDFNRCCLYFTFEGYEPTRTLSIYRRMDQCVYKVHIEKPERLSQDVTKTVIEIHFAGPRTLHALMDGKFDFIMAVTNNLVRCKPLTEIDETKWADMACEIIEFLRDRGPQLQEKIHENPEWGRHI